MSSRRHSGAGTFIQPAELDRPEVEVRASTRRTKTGSAHWSGSRIIVQIPARLRGSERVRFVDDLVEQLVRQRPAVMTSDAALEARAQVLADLYNDGVAPSGIRWSRNMSARWASCSPATREIRVSDTLRNCPEWVIDAVLVHELAHLHEADHNKAFYAIANRHPRQRECEIFLDGYALGLGLAIDGADVL
ncbi:MAG: M48 family metallopeptidase [Acidobacteria bacterium]|nr:M48 family metallopeptidase [Acidobacteriota bacterium]